MNDQTKNTSSSNQAIDRRRAIQRAVGAATLGTALLSGASASSAEKKENGPAISKGRINQSIVHWCFNLFGEEWTVDQTAQAAKQLGCKSVELVGPEDWPTLKKYGLTCAIAPNGMPGAPFVKGFNNPRYHDEVIGVTSKMIDSCAEHGIKNVIAFTGFKYHDAEDPKSGEISLADGAKNCVAGFKKILKHAEKKGVTICLEHLNSRDSSHPMKGHPGYQGDDVDYVVDIIRQVGSPHLKLLFDIYHVQIMNGDVIRRINQFKDVIGHIHTAGNPGRNELDQNQEITYEPVMRALLDIGYTGFVGQEFIPTRKPIDGLRQAAKRCDV